jgi:Tol biopolymer transport system component
MAYLSGPSTAPNGYALFTMKADGTGQTRLGTGGFDADRGAWSPDGRWILVSSFESSHLVLVDAATGAIGKELTSGPDRAPAWSPDGTSIVFSRQLSDMTIFVMRADGSSLKQLTAPPPGTTDGYPTWSPDGRLIAFHRYTQSSSSGQLVATVLLVDAQGNAVSWPDGFQHLGDLPIWRPRP